MKKDKKSTPKGKIKAFLKKNGIPFERITAPDGKRLWKVRGAKFETLEAANRLFRFVEL